MFQSMFIKYCFSTIRTLGTFYLLRRDVWNAGFSENRKILFFLFVNAIFVCNVPIVKNNIVKKNRPELILYHIIGLGSVTKYVGNQVFQSIFNKFCFSTIRTLGRIYNYLKMYGMGVFQKKERFFLLYL